MRRFAEPRFRHAQLGWAVGVFVGMVSVWWFARWNFDDGLIIARIARNVLEGHGWVFNPGQIHDAATSFLNLLSTVAVGAVVRDIPLAQHLIGGFAIAWTAASVVELLLVRGAHVVGACAAAGLMGAYQATNLTWGLEANLFFAIALAIVVADEAGKPWWGFLPLLILCRPDGVIFAGAVLVATAVRRQPVLVPTLAVSVVVGAWLVWHRATFGTFLPNTFAAKVWQGRSGLWGSGPIYLVGYVQAVKQKWVFRLALWVAAIFGAPVALSRRSLLPLLAAAVVVQQAAYAVLNVPAYGWYYVPLESVLMVFAVAGFGWWKEALAPNATPARLVLGGGLVAGALCFTGIRISSLPRVDGRDQMYAEAIEALDRSDPSPQPVAALEVGTIAYHTRRPVVDLVSLTTPNPEFVSGQNTEQFFAARYPWVLLHDPINPLERAVGEDPLFEVLYEPKLATPGMKSYARRTTGHPDVKEFISRRYPALQRASQVTILGKPAVKAFIDRINGYCAVKPGLTIVRGWLRVEGWTQDGQTDAVALLDSKGTCFIATGIKLPRPDVAEKYGRAACGFRVEANTYDLAPGHYTVCLAHRSGNATEAYAVSDLFLQ